MATVYLATDLKHGRDVAVKVVHPVLASAWARIDFSARSKSLPSCSTRTSFHSTIPERRGGALYYAHASQVGSVAAAAPSIRETRLPVDDVVLIMRDVCDALTYAHERGIVHQRHQAGQHPLVWPTRDGHRFRRREGRD